MGAGVSLLADLNLQDCQKLTNISLRYTSQGLRITAINLSFCANISDSSLKSAARMATLASLNLRSCDNIGDIGMGYLASECEAIHTLTVLLCELPTWACRATSWRSWRGACCGGCPASPTSTSGTT